jgi:bifunctional non-homologous end joining protein LigD
MKSKKPLVKGVKSAMPRDIAPMEMKSGEEAFNDKDWIYEVKWDGFRCIAYCDGKNVELKSKNNNLFNKKFSSISLELPELNLRAVLDGEIVMMDSNGRPNFDKMIYTHQDGLLVYYVFDLLWYNGYDLRNVPLIARRKILKAILPKSGAIRFSEHFSGEKGKELYELAIKHKLEGIVAKRKNSIYKSNFRTDSWLKIKTGELVEAFVAGYVLDLDNPGYSSILIGREAEKGFQFLGAVGTGVTTKTREKIFAEKSISKSIFKPEPKVNRKTPFSNPIKNPKIVWIKPTLRCKVKYLELDKSGIMRHPSFKGLL